MKVLLCMIVFWLTANSFLQGQTTVHSSGPSFSKKDTTTANVLSVASMQVYPVGIDKLGTEKEPEPAQDSAVIITSTPSIKSDEPIRDWSNPSGYMGASGPPSNMTRHKPLSPAKYHRRHLKRCYTF